MMWTIKFRVVLGKKRVGHCEVEVGTIAISFRIVSRIAAWLPEKAH